MAGADLSDGLRAGVLAVAAGEALGLRWAGVAPRAITLRRLYDDVGPTGEGTAALLADGAATDGPALVRALAIGWRSSQTPAQRRAAALPLGFSAVVVADLAAGALAGRPIHQLVTDHGKEWGPPFHGIAADDREVVAAVMAVLHRHDDPAEGIRAAVRLGGGGAPLLGAVTGGILGCRRPSAVARIPWLERVALPDEAALARAVAALGG